MTRYYYQLLDFVQRNWLRFRETEAGRAVIWLTPRLLRWSWFALKLSLAFFAAYIVVMFGVMFALVMVLTGNGKAAISSFTKITLAIIAVFAATKLVKNKPEIGAAIKAITK